MPFESQFGILIDPSSLSDTKTPPISPVAYENGVRRILIKIAASKVGQAVLNTIRSNHRVVRIVPNVMNPNVCAPADTDEGDPMQYKWNAVTNVLNNVARTHLPVLRGKVNFTPGMYAKGGPCQKLYAPRAQYTPSEDEVLLHELVHGARMVSLKFDLGPSTVARKGLSMYDSDEEFFAVLVENIYLSELKSGHLRSSHTSFMEMDQNLQSSLAFFQVSGNAFEKIEKFATQNPGLAKALSKIEVPFNPVNAYFCHTAKAREMSKSSYAKVRDLGPIGMVFAPLLLGKAGPASSTTGK
ncbi:MAG TPA: hypothetical protein VKU19_29585 [Bryobacteraceae bacterium]|nr:hypothetical protein [Bryobacteraceae bacterium]